MEKIECEMKMSDRLVVSQEQRIIILMERQEGGCSSKNTVHLCTVNVVSRFPEPDVLSSRTRNT